MQSEFMGCLRPERPEPTRVGPFREGSTGREKPGPVLPTGSAQISSAKRSLALARGLPLSRCGSVNPTGKGSAPKGRPSWTNSRSPSLARPAISGERLHRPLKHRAREHARRDFSTD
jgi:hypothetical protein